MDHLPCAELYEKSFMHRDIVTHVATTKTEFIITGSQDGHVKFWKKQPVGIEFVKHFRAHLGFRYQQPRLIFFRTYYCNKCQQ